MQPVGLSKHSLPFLSPLPPHTRPTIAQPVNGTETPPRVGRTTLPLDPLEIPTMQVRGGQQEEGRK